MRCYGAARPHPALVPVDASAPTAGRRTSRAAALFVLVGLAAVGVATWVHRPAAQLLGLVALSTVTSFGGGEAYVAVADGFFVAGGHVEPDVFYNLLVPVANALPGPILIKLASAVGFASAATSGTATAWLVGSAAGLVAISTGASVALLVLGAYDRVSHSPVVRDLGAVLLPIIGGLLVSTSISMLVAAGRWPSGRRWLFRLCCGCRSVASQWWPGSAAVGSTTLYSS